MATSSSFAWPSVVVYRGSTVIRRRTIVKCNWSNNFGIVLEKLGSEFAGEAVIQAVISSNERMTEPTHAVPLDAPFQLLETYGCHYVRYNLAGTVAQAETQEPNALSILMQNAGRLVLPPAVNVPVCSSSEQQLRGNQRLRNDVLQYLQERKVGWSPSTVSTTGEQLVKVLTSALWYLDPHHKQLSDR